MSTVTSSKMSRPTYAARATATSQPKTSGNLALKARAQLGAVTSWRPTIEVVSTRSHKKARPRVFYAVITVAVIFAIIIAQLLVSVAVASGAYEISSLKQANKELSRTYQTVTQDLDRLASPQNLAANAEALGMVNNSTPVYLRLSDGAVLGTPEAAAATAGLIAGAEGAVPNHLLTGVQLVTQKESEAKAEEAKKAAEEAMKNSPNAALSVPSEAIPAGPVALTNGLPGLSTR
jgi:hypothetical protein